MSATIDDLIAAFQSGLVKVGLRDAVTIGGTSDVHVTNAPHVTVDGMPTVTVNAHALTASNATIGTVNNTLYNGTAWDSQRGAGLASTTGDTGSKTASGNGATMTNVGNKGVQVTILIGAVTGAPTTSSFKIQSSVNGGTDWVDVPGATTPNLSSAGAYGIVIYPGVAVVAGSGAVGSVSQAASVLPRTWRVAWVIAGGSTPAIPLTSVQYQYLVN